MANEENKVVTLDEKLKAERAFFLRKTDKIPGSDLTLEEARKNQAKVNAKFEEDKRERAQRVNAKTIKESKGTTFTSMVVPGVNVEVKAAAVLPAEIVETKLPDLPSDADLKKMSVAELTTLAGNRGVEVKANVDTEAAIIARIKGDYSDARFAPLSGKSREILDGYAVELGVAQSADEIKTKFANAELLSEAIESARKK
jgi:hypothetical protein